MFAVKIKEQDGYKIVESFRTLTIDPVTTSKIKDKKLHESAEYKNFQELRDKYQKVRLDPNFKNKDIIDELGANVKEAEKRMHEKSKELTIACAVYFEPGKDEEKITSQEYETLIHLKNNLKKNQLLTLDGQILESHIGETWFDHKKNRSVVIETLNIPDHIKQDKPLQMSKDYKKQEFKMACKRLAIQPFVLIFTSDDTKYTYMDMFRPDQIEMLENLIKNHAFIYLFDETKQRSIRVKLKKINLKPIKEYAYNLYTMNQAYNQYVDSIDNLNDIKKLEYTDKFVINNQDYQFSMDRLVVPISKKNIEDIEYLYDSQQEYAKPSDDSVTVIE